MRIDVKDKDVFIPEFNGNRDLDDGEQIKVHYRYPTPGERERFFGMAKDWTVDVKSESAQPVWHNDPAGLVKALVTHIENLDVGSGDKVEKVANGAKMYTTRGVPSALVREIETFIVGVEPEVDTHFLG